MKKQPKYQEYDKQYKNILKHIRQMPLYEKNKSNRDFFEWIIEGLVRVDVQDTYTASEMIFADEHIRPQQCHRNASIISSMGGDIYNHVFGLHGFIDSWIYHSWNIDNLRDVYIDYTMLKNRRPDTVPAVHNNYYWKFTSMNINKESIVKYQKTLLKANDKSTRVYMQRMILLLYHDKTGARITDSLLNANLDHIFSF